MLVSSALRAHIRVAKNQDTDVSAVSKHQSETKYLINLKNV